MLEQIKKEISIPFRLLAKYQNEGHTIYFFPNPGNTGDGLILLATLNLFEKFHIKFRLTKRLDNLPPKSILVYGGGGGIKGIYPGNLNFVSKLLADKRPLFILNHSILNADDLLKKFHSDVYVWAREKRSFEYLSNFKQKSYKCFLNHDIALSFDILDSKSSLHNAMRTGTKKRQGENSILYALRQDIESKKQTSLPTGNIDLSTVTYFENPKSFKYTEINKLALQYQISLFLNHISFFDKVYTDRLHVAISSMLLQKEIELFDNTDFKISDVYEHSLKSIDQKIKINW